jgi:hypothetical protein
MNHDCRAEGVSEESVEKTATQSTDRTGAPTGKEFSRCVSFVELAINEVQMSQIFDQIRALLSDVGDVSAMTMWGLGSLEQLGGIHIRYQLALGVLLKGLITDRNHGSRFETYDPVYTALDEAVLEGSYGFVVRENQNGRIEMLEPTLLYMPHCEAVLTANLLKENQTNGSLHNIIMIGNSLASYKEKYEMGVRRDCSGVRYLVDLVSSGVVNETKLSGGHFDVAGAFNDLSFHTFTS